MLRSPKAKKNLMHSAMEGFNRLTQFRSAFLTRLYHRDAQLAFSKTAISLAYLLEWTQRAHLRYN
jgi:hypothetical protein